MFAPVPALPPPEELEGEPPPTAAEQAARPKQLKNNQLDINPRLGTTSASTDRELTRRAGACPPSIKEPANVA